MLHRTPTQVLVQLGDVDGCCALLVLRGGVPYPVVNISRLTGALFLSYLVISMNNTEGDLTLAHISHMSSYMLSLSSASWEISQP